MYDELVKKIRHCATDPMHCLSCGEVKDGRCFKRLMTQAADAIEKLEITIAGLHEAIKGFADDMPRWIPVTERKPKTDDIVIVAIHDDSGDTPYDVTNVGFYLDVFPLGIWVVENERCNYVTHWMPLPQGPGEK